MLGKNTISKFNKLSGYDITTFFQLSRIFFKTGYVEIEKFYSGKLNFINKKHFVNLNILEHDSKIITSIFKEKRNLMKTVDFWELLDMVENLKTAFQRTQKLSKYLRSSITQGKLKSGFVFAYQMSAEETMEDVAKNILKRSDFQNAGQNVALDNDLREVDWDIDGGTNLLLRDNSFQNNLVTSMIDNTLGERIYGLDLTKLLKFIPADDDLAVLGYKDTAYQSVDILSTLNKNDIPEFPSLGLAGDIYKGVNFSQLNYPSIVREMTKTFNTDDLFIDFKVKSLSHLDGDLYLEFEVNTKYNLLIIKQVTI